jgi:imidazolonepropionase-like amidohydrolase
MTPMETIISATRWGGQMMMRKDLGEIREGWLADLLLVDGDPIANIKLLEDPEKNLLVIMKDGRIYKNALRK